MAVVHKVHSIQPINGPTIGGTHVFLNGEDFSANLRYEVRFDKRAVVAAQFESERHLSLHTPPHNKPECVEVEIRAVGEDKWQSTGNVFTYLDFGDLSNERPSGGPPLVDTAASF